MSSSNASKSSTPARNGVVKSVKIKLKVSPEILAKFPHTKSNLKSSARSSPAITTDAASPSANIKEEGEKAETNDDKTTEGDKKTAASAKAGVKRDASAMGSTTTTTATTTAAKPRSRPSLKRRKIETEDQQPWTVTMTGPGAHKLGPKANQGAINAGLRALDRSGKPCRKWGKKTFSVRSFNGSDWSLNHWTAPPKQDVKADGVENDTPSTNSGDHQASSNVPSVASHQPGESKEPNGVGSPAVVAASA